MSRPTPPAYKTRNWPAYNDARKRRGSLTIWFDPAMTWEAAPTGKRGRQPDDSDAAIQTCLTMKVLFGMALRQTTGFVESLLHLIGLDWAVPNFSTLSRRQRTLKVNIPYRGSPGPLHLLIDIEPVSATGSSEPARGIKVEGEGEWSEADQKTGVGPRFPAERASMAGPNGASGARSTSELTRKRWKSGRPGSPPATSVTRPCCPSFSTRSRPNRRSPASPLMVPSTPASAMTPSLPAVQRPSFRPARTPSHGSPTPEEQSPATRPGAPQSASVGPSGDDGAVTTAEAASRYEPGQKTIQWIVFPAIGCTM